MNTRVLSELCVCYLYDVLLFLFFDTICMREYNVLLFGFRFVFRTLNKYMCECVCTLYCVCWMFSMRCENVVHRLLLLLLLKLFIFRWLCECVKFMYVNMWAGILCVDTIIFGVYKTKLSDNTTTTKNYQRSLKMYFVARTNREKKNCMRTISLLQKYRFHVYLFEFSVLNHP